MLYNRLRSLANAKSLQLFKIELPRDLSKLKPKFRKPLNVEEILEELYDNEPHLKYNQVVDVEPEVTLKEGRRFAFVRHDRYFL